MSFEPVFSPDGNSIAFVDSSEPPARLWEYRISSGALRLVRRASEEENSYRLLDWK
jgi:Tol biopolymer transport system component